MRTINWEKVARNSVHPMQRLILEHLSQNGKASPVQIAKALKMPLSNTAYHVTVLRDWGVIREVGTRPVRGAVEHFYALEA